MNFDELQKKILSQTSLSEYISRTTSLVSKGGSHIGLCPFHTDSNPSFSVKDSIGIFNCFSCNKKGGIIKFVELKENLSFSEAAAKLAEEFNIEWNGKVNIEKFTPEQENAISANVIANSYFRATLKKNLKSNSEIINYLSKRNLDVNDINKFQIGYADGNLANYLIKNKIDTTYFEIVDLINESSRDFFYNRLIFPIYDSKNNLAGFSGRVLTDQNKPKYLNSSDNLIFSKAKVLYNFHNAISEAKNLGFLIIVEGFFDVISLSKIGINNVVAIMGTSFSVEHLIQIKGLEIVLFLDNDKAGLKATLDHLLTLNKYGFSNSVIFYNNKNGASHPKSNYHFDELFTANDLILEYKKVDADEIASSQNGKEIISKLIGNRVSGIDFYYKILRQQFNFSNSQNISNFINEFSKIISYQSEVIINRFTSLLNSKHNLGVNFKKMPIKYLKDNVGNFTRQTNYQNAPVDIHNPEPIEIPRRNNNFNIQDTLNTAEFNKVQETNNSKFGKLIIKIVTNVNFLNAYVNLKKKHNKEDIFEFAPSEYKKIENQFQKFYDELSEEIFDPKKFMDSLSKEDLKTFNKAKLDYISTNPKLKDEDLWTEDEIQMYLLKYKVATLSIEIERLKALILKSTNETDKEVKSNLFEKLVAYTIKKDKIENKIKKLSKK
ncbi:DNA primase catalytic core [Mycoplasma testudineum]|uniref:DNA primase n=1 Tax=Mycoplasma testudineum TaxID=244584 RepID=A0A4R6IC54_9MOLU|nr:DNA primase [Mycoplasma testudineum]OYD26690.1 DNA primase [Mycoplasma testudineum]TDO19820.1 DNA primase catalytic core [Mycoplasma testudineum]